MFHRSNCVRLVLFVAFIFSLFVGTGNSQTLVGVSGGGVIAQVQQQCPTVIVTSPDSVKAGDPLMFTANVTGRDKNVSPTYNWSISAGTISSGQGTSTITVDAAGLDGQTATATVELGGYDRKCSVYASGTTIIDQKPEAKKITEY